MGSDGKVRNHATWTPNSKNPSGFDSVQRTDLKGAAHIDKKTGQSIKTPHTHTKDGNIRPAKKDEKPKN